MTKKILIEYKAKNETDTIKFARQSLKHFKSGDTILLYGNLGSGKTFLTKKFSQLLGVNFEVTSPSFSIINQYQGDFLINHIDFYRVENKNELLNLGLDDILNMDSINFIEWPQIIENKITWQHYRIYIEFNHNNPNGRFFKLISTSIK
jgi:tRNA threonylcarbamoyladenosine biosynthesis protein TsaE